MAAPPDTSGTFSSSIKRAIVYLMEGKIKPPSHRAVRADI